MEDLWRVKSSSVDMKDLTDLAEYHRFLDRFKEEEVDDNKLNITGRLPVEELKPS